MSVGGSFAATWARMVLKKCSSERLGREKRFYVGRRSERRRTAFWRAVQNTLGASGAKPTRTCVPRTVNGTGQDRFRRRPPRARLLEQPLMEPRAVHRVHDLLHLLSLRANLDQPHRDQALLPAHEDRRTEGQGAGRPQQLRRQVRVRALSRAHRSGAG